MKRLLMTLWLAATGAQGQETAPSPKAAIDTVEVVGHRAKLGKEVHSFVSTLTKLDGELVSSWAAPICPKVVAEDAAHAEYVRRRLLEVAAEVPFDANSDAKCRANLFVVLTGAPEEFIAGWKERDPGMFIWRPRRGVSRSPESLPVRTWHNVAIEPAGGGPMVTGSGAIPSTGAKSTGLGELPTTSSYDGGSRLDSKVSENLQSALVLVDTNKAAGVTLRQLADYIAMVSFSKVDLEADFGQANSILRLFAGDEATVRPGGLTAWDLAFLRGLYRQSFEAVHQRTAIASRMVRDLIEHAPRDAQP
jgi:hypothetical protein